MKKGNGMELSFETDRLDMRILNRTDAPKLLHYFKRNEAFLEPWEVKREPAFFTVEHMEGIIEDDILGLNQGHTLRLWLFKKDDPRRIIGSVALSNIVRGAFLSSYIGYRLDGQETNKGYMTEAVRAMVDIAFDRLRLHRIEANIIPRNKASLRTVEKAGFEYEGLSPKYLKINGVWEDHVHMVIRNRALEEDDLEKS